MVTDPLSMSASPAIPVDAQEFQSKQHLTCKLSSNLMTLNKVDRVLLFSGFILTCICVDVVSFLFFFGSQYFLFHKS